MQMILNEGLGILLRQELFLQSVLTFFGQSTLIDLEKLLKKVYGDWN